MRIMSFLLFCHSGCSFIDWTPAINALPGICWGVIALVGLYFLLKFAITPLIANCHDLKVKEMNNKHEDGLAEKKKINEATLKQKENDLEIEKLKTSLAQMKVKAYEDFYDKVSFNVSLKDDGGKGQAAESEGENAQIEGDNQGQEESKSN